jgi:hypothetical protein
MNLKILDSIKTQVRSIDTIGGAELRKLQSNKEVSLEALNQIEMDLKKAQDDLAAAASKAASKVVDPLKQSLGSQGSKLAGMTVPLTQVNYLAYLNMKDIAQNVNSAMNVASSATELGSKMADVSSAVASKTTTLSRIADLVAQKKASLSPADLAKFNALPKPDLAAVTTQASQARASLDMEFSL